MEKTESLKKNKEFRTLYKRGRSKAGKYLVIYFLKNKEGKNRIGITVSKKLGKAVQRNRAKRLIREAYRLLESSVKDGVDIIIVARGVTLSSNGNTVRCALFELLDQCGLLKDHTVSR